MKLDDIFETALYMNDLEEGRTFYERLLDTPSFANSPGRHVFFKLKHGMLLLFEPEVTNDPAAELPPHGCTGRGHLAFRVDEGDMPRWRERLAELGVPIEKEWTWPSGAPSIYFRDPAGNLLELTVARLWGF